MTIDTLKIDGEDYILSNYSNCFIIITSEALSSLSLLGESIYQKNYKWIDEVISTEIELCLKINSHYHEKAIEELSSIQLTKEQVNKSYTLPCCLEMGTDWDVVCKINKADKPDLVNKLKAATLTVAMHGFLPGFIYLNGLPEELILPRKARPAMNRQRGDLACGGPYLGIYNIDSPGGWYHLGSTPLNLLNINTLPISPFRIGDQLTLKEITPIEYKRLEPLKLSLKEYNETL